MSEIWRDEVHEKDRKEKLATYLFAMKEDLSEWIAGLMNISVSADTFMSVLDNGIHLCRLANMIQKAAEKYLAENAESSLKLPEFVPTYNERRASHGSFVSRDNVANFIRWCRALGITDVIIFESEDLVLHKFQKPVILTLLEVARRASKFDIEPPDLVIMEEQIDEEIALEAQAIALEQTGEDVTPVSQVRLQNNCDATKPVVVKSKKKHAKQKVKNFIPKNLDTLVKEVVQQCTCEDSFPVEKIADGKYKIGENRVLIFVRVMRNHVMVRVGGGWDTLENYIQKHDPCRAGGRSSITTGGGRQRSKCQTPNHQQHHHHHDHENTILHSASNTSVASNDSTSSSSSSVSRLSPVNNNNSVLQGMVCVFGESGSHPEIVSLEKTSPSNEQTKLLNPPAKSSAKRKNSAPSKQSGGGKDLGSRNNSLNDVRDSGIVVGRTKHSSNKTPVKNTQASRASLQQADLTFSRSKTSDAILSRCKRRETDSPSSVMKRRGNGNLSREPSSENMRRPKSTGRRKSVGKRSPEIRRRSAVSPAPARRKLEDEYEASAVKKNDMKAERKSALRKDLNENNLMFSRSFSADTIMRGRGARRQADTPQNSPRNSMIREYGTPSRIPGPVTTYGKPRAFNRTYRLNDGSSSASNGVNDGSLANGDEGSIEISRGNNRLDQGINKCIHCASRSCTCDEGFIDDEVTRTPLRPTSLFHNHHNDLDYKNKDANCSSNGNWNGNNHLNYENSMYLDIPQQHNGDGFSGNSDSLEWKDVVTDILNYEENRITDKNL
ncbi:GAS2-like protein 1 [Dendronephthya gigantea]|uniref:GAS2-like protein 1 n=1 Tax=Dendronephthya gigantea TaxID=151771 RepID=UPI00106C5878|nr:GAS2-like protein 1 [Dendronephthya gigantea]